MSQNNTQKIVNTSYIDTILRRLYDWMPFKRKNGGIVQDSKDENGESTLTTLNDGEIALGKYNSTDSNTILTIGIGDKIEKKNAIKICKNGEIYIVTNLLNGKVESLQTALDKKGVEVCSDYESMIPYISEEYLGKCIYLTQSSSYNDNVYDEGLYIVSLSTKTGEKIKLVKIGDSLKNDLSNYYTKEEVNELIKDITAGDLSDIYYSKDDIDNIVMSLNDRIEIVEEFIDEPINVNELESIIKKDLNNDGNIG